MRAAMRAYMGHLKAVGCTDRTLESWLYRLKGFVDFAAERGVKALRNVARALVREYADSLAKRGLKASTRRSCLQVVKGFLAWAHENGMILSDLAASMELPKLDERLPPTPLTHDEVNRLFALLAGKSVPRLRDQAIVEVLYGAGLRRSELLALDVKDLDAAEETVTVRQGKGRKDRVVPINPGAVKAVERYLEADGHLGKKGAPLFRTEEKTPKRLNQQAVAALFGRIRKRFHRRVHPHLMRHTYAIHLLQGGADIRHVQMLLGHESPETTGHYLNLIKGELKKLYDQAVEGML